MKNIVKIFCTFVFFVISMVLQLFVFNNITLFGVKPNILLISIVVVSIYTNLYFSTVYAFVVGFISDLIFGTNGMFTIIYTALGMILGFISDNYMKENALSAIIMTIFSVAIFEIIQYFRTMIKIKQYISIFYFIGELLVCILLNVVVVSVLSFIYGKIIEIIDKKQNKIYW